MKNILVAIDVKTTDALLIDHASNLAGKFGSKVWLIHIAAPDPDFVGYEPGPQYIRDFRAKDLRDEHKSLQKYVEELKSKNIEAEGILVQGPTVEMILDEATKLQIDLILLGAHQHNFFYRLFRDDTSFEIVRKSKIPLFIVPID